jgi:hypothetical protein
MPSVMVDLDDLETLVMTTGALKTVEQALNARKSDPFVRAHLDFTDAHDRLASQMRNARRSQNKDTVIEFDGKLTEAELGYLTQLEESLAGYFLYHDEKYSNSRLNITSLQAKGMVHRGRYLNGVLWEGENHPQLKEDTKGFAVKLTQRGKEAVWKYWTEKEKS